MPEGDSVYRLARRLDRSLLGRAVTRSDLRVPAHATDDLAGRRVLENLTHGKHLLTRLSDDLTLHTHLRLDGSWTVTAPGRQLPTRLMPEVRVVLQVESGATAYGITLPVVELVRTSEEHDVVGHLGPDPLRDAGTPRRRYAGSAWTPPDRSSRRSWTSGSWPAGGTFGSEPARCASRRPPNAGTR